LIQLVITSDRICEIRESKLKPDENWKDNMKNLIDLFQATTSIIFSTVQQCPIPMRKVFYHIRKEVREVFNDPDVEYTAITGFLFLRFFVPAIMTPKLFGLADEYLTGNTERNFTLIATVLQKLANLLLFDPHESHFDAMNDVLAAEQANMKKFIDTLSSNDSDIEDNLSTHINEVDLDLMVARLCRYISAHQSTLEEALPDKDIISFLGELDSVFGEMKFLWKNYKHQQVKKRDNQLHSTAFTQSAPPTPISREKSRTASFREIEGQKVKRRHSFSLERISIVKTNSKSMT